MGAGEKHRSQAERSLEVRQDPGNYQDGNRQGYHNHFARVVVWPAILMAQVVERAIGRHLEAAFQKTAADGEDHGGRRERRRPWVVEEVCRPPWRGRIHP